VEFYEAPPLIGESGSRWRWSLHLAAHAVLAQVHGLSLGTLSLRAFDFEFTHSLYKTGCPCCGGPDLDPAQAEAVIVTLNAGPQAELLFFGYVNLSDSDQRTIDQNLMDLHGRNKRRAPLRARASRRWRRIS
jgi:hypothetical protein